MTRPGFPRTRRLRRNRACQDGQDRPIHTRLAGVLAATLLFLLLVAAITDWRAAGVDGCHNAAGWISCTSEAGLAEAGDG